MMYPIVHYEPIGQNVSVADSIAQNYLEIVVFNHRGNCFHYIIILKGP